MLQAALDPARFRPLQRLKTFKDFSQITEGIREDGQIGSETYATIEIAADESNAACGYRNA
jgi:hypothetical protein